MSVASNSSTPPPAHTPLTAATMGLVYGSLLSSARPIIRAISSRADRSPLMSAPALNARSPAPVSTMQRHGPRSSSSQSRTRSAIMARVIAFMRAWLSIVSRTTWPWVSTRISMRLPRARLDHELAVSLAIGQSADRLHAALEREAIADQRAELALAVPAQQLVDRDLELVRRVPAEVAQRGAERGAVLHQQAVGGDLLHATHEPDQENATTPPERGERGVEQVAADGIEAHVGAPVVGQRHHALGQLLGGVVDDLIGATLARHRKLLGGAGTGDHPGAHGLADLHRGEPDTAGRAQHQQRLAGLEPPLPADRHVARNVGNGKRAGF